MCREAMFWLSLMSEVPTIRKSTTVERFCLRPSDIFKPNQTEESVFNNANNITQKSRRDTVFNGCLFDPVQLRLHMFGVLTEINPLKEECRETGTP